MDTLGIGLIGCGNISAAYLRLAPLFRGLHLVAVADIDMQAAEARAAEFGVRADSVADILQADDIDIIVNLTVPDAHFEVSRQALEAGKHVYSEKPYVLRLDEADTLSDLATRQGLRIGSAPDTFLGGSHQTTRSLIDSGSIGPSPAAPATSCPMAWNIGIRTLISSFVLAADRYLILGPITSPILYS